MIVDDIPVERHSDPYEDKPSDSAIQQVAENHWRSTRPHYFMQERQRSIIVHWLEDIYDEHGVYVWLVYIMALGLFYSDTIVIHVTNTGAIEIAE